MSRRLRQAVGAVTRRAGRPLALALVVGCVVFVVQRRGGEPGQVHQFRCSSLPHPLSLQPVAERWYRPGRHTVAGARRCLRRQGVSRVLFIGHSRLRQVFERMSAHLRLPPVTRLDARRAALSAATFRDLPLQPGWVHFATANSTCLEVWPKPNADGYDGPPRAWCSLAAAAPGLTLEFRWRFALKGFLSTLAELSSACAAAGDCVDVLLLTQGLHYLVSGSFSSTSAVYAETLRRAAALLKPMTARGTRVVWMLEQPSNTRNKHDAEGMNDDMTVLAPLARESLLELDGRGVWVWSSHLKIVTDFLMRSCRAKMYETAADEKVCDDEIYHVNNASLDRMSDEVMDFMCGC
ncbi:uncharacterized protein LOC122368666 [Amphibalanus amphitrite]|uniref:uncharacterized protein LOC122368666 n=1 Tax=Amphibalanus amphitrite TaxID=1232801 RepID=UPI001C91ADB6|nr:uncharacterized protein LOC122368666 [Amphibalanus amphitrite]